MTDIDMNEKELNEFLSYCREMIKQIDHTLGVDDGLIAVKTIAFAGFVKYYGAEHFNDIYLAFLKTKFVKCNGSINEVLVNNYGISYEDSLKYSEHCPGVLYVPVAVKNLKTNKYSIKRTMYVDYSLTDMTRLIESIVHQMNHVVNSIYNPIVNKKLVGLGSRMGIAVDHFSSRYCDLLDLEEVFSKLQSEEIMSRIIEFSFFDIAVPGVSEVLDDVFHNIGKMDESEDDYFTEIVRPLYQNAQFNQVLVDRRLSGKLTGIREEFDGRVGEGAYSQFLDICGKLSDSIDSISESSCDDAKKLVKTYLEKTNDN